MKRSGAATQAAVASTTMQAPALKVQPSSAFTSLPTKKDIVREKRNLLREKEKFKDKQEHESLLEKEKEKEKDQAKIRLTDMLVDDLDMVPQPAVAPPSMILQTPFSSNINQQPPSSPPSNDYIWEDSPSKDPEDGYIRETSIEVSCAAARKVVKQFVIDVDFNRLNFQVYN